jgi:hypothetical protein
MQDQEWWALQGSAIEKTKNCLASPQVISEKKSQKKLIFLELKKDIVKKKKVNFLLDILNQNFMLFL